MSLMESLEVDADIAKHLRYAQERARDDGMKWKDLFAPRDTGNLVDKMEIYIVNDDLVLVSDADYSVYVNEMRGVNWTNRSTIENFFDEWVEFVKSRLIQAIEEEFGGEIEI